MTIQVDIQINEFHLEGSTINFIVKTDKKEYKAAQWLFSTKISIQDHILSQIESMLTEELYNKKKEIQNRRYING